MSNEFIHNANCLGAEILFEGPPARRNQSRVSQGGVLIGERWVRTDKTHNSQIERDDHEEGERTPPDEVPNEYSQPS